MQHTFTDSIIANHFIKTPPPNGSCKLIDLPGDVFLDTEEDLNVIGATLWIMSVEYDKIQEKDRPKNREELRRVSRLQMLFRISIRISKLCGLISALTSLQWIIVSRNTALPRMLHKIEPPFRELFCNPDMSC